MIFSPTELFVARRMARSSDGAAPRRGVMRRIATVAVALSLAVMIITLAVIFGFKREVHHKLTALSGSVVVATAEGVSTSASDHILHSETAEATIAQAAQSVGGEVTHMSPYALRAAVVRGGSMVDGVVLKGVDASYDMSLFANGLIDGELPQFGGAATNRNVVIAKELADDLGVNVGGRLELLLSQSDGSAMRRDLYRVGAIYSAGLGSAERGVVVADISNLRRLNGWTEDQISGYEVSLAELNSAPRVAEAINDQLLFEGDDSAHNMAAFAVQQLNPSVFDWLAAHDINGVVVVVIMLVVAIFNVVTALLIMVMERSRMIGTLKALGMRNGSISRVFMVRALAITLRGMAWGNGVGLAVCWVQARYHLLRLDEAGYMLSAVPIEWRLGWWLAINGVVVATIFVAVMLPARLVSAIEPHRAIKFQ